MRFVSAAFVRVREDGCPIPDHCEPRRTRKPERQGLLRRRPEYDYFHDVDYLAYFDYSRSESEDPRFDV